MNIKHNIYDFKIRLDAIELLLIARGETTREDLEIFKREVQENYSKAQDEFQQKQWAKIKVGSTIEYELTSTSSLALEVINISPEPFQFLAGKIVNKSGKSGYRIGEIFTAHCIFEITLKTGYGLGETISRE